jgi:hypothetical protein
MTIIRVKTQKELDDAIAKYDRNADEIWIVDDAEVTVLGQATVHAGGQATVRAGGQATVRAGGQATVHAGGQATVHAWDQATVHAGDQATVHAGGQATVRAWDQATVRAWDQATVRAWDQATVRAWGQATVHAKKYVAIQLINGHTGKVTGGVIIKIPVIDTIQKWIDYYNVEKKKNGLMLYKALDKDLKSGHGMTYPVGEDLTAPDWDGGKEECGGGLHFCASPWEALQYHEVATRFVACRVCTKDIRTPLKSDGCKNKVKAQSCKVLYECDIDGKRMK